MNSKQSNFQRVAQYLTTTQITKPNNLYHGLKVQEDLSWILIYLCKSVLSQSYSNYLRIKELFEQSLKIIFKFLSSFQAVLVHTAESIRIRYFLDLLMSKKTPVMLVGNSGCGKTVLINEKLTSLSENYVVANIPFNFYTTSEMLQKIMEKPLEKKAGRNYGPPGNKTLVYFIDDMNMPEVDMYGTVQPHTLIRQHLDYRHW